MSDNAVYLPGEYCEVCHGTTRLGKMSVRGSHFTVCVWCHEDDAKMKAWFMREMEAALEESPEYQKLPDGKWIHV